MVIDNDLTRFVFRVSQFFISLYLVWIAIVARPLYLRLYAMAYRYSKHTCSLGVVHKHFAFSLDKL